jgi:hypothetical protein
LVFNSKGTEFPEHCFYSFLIGLPLLTVLVSGRPSQYALSLSLSLSMSEVIKCQEVARIREAETKYVTKEAITDVSAVEEADHGVSRDGE